MSEGRSMFNNSLIKEEKGTPRTESKQVGWIKSLAETCAKEADNDLDSIEKDLQALRKWYKNTDTPDESPGRIIRHMHENLENFREDYAKCRMVKEFAEG